MKIAQRAEKIAPFYVMEVAKAAASQARDLAGSPDPMIFLNMGEPDFTAPPRVQAAAVRAIEHGNTQYTPATGIAPLREAISGWYASRFGVAVDPRRIVITAGASAALQLACLALIEAGDEILMPDPSYPCNRHFVSAAEGLSILIPTTAQERFQLTLAKVEAAWGQGTLCPSASVDHLIKRQRAGYGIGEMPPFLLVVLKSLPLHAHRILARIQTGHNVRARAVRFQSHNLIGRRGRHRNSRARNDGCVRIGHRADNAAGLHLRNNRARAKRGQNNSRHRTS